MLKKPQKESLADKISDVLSSAPVSFDPEDDIDGATLVAPDYNEDFEDAEPNPTILRLQHPSIFLDEDERYKGKKSSRKDLKESNESDSDQKQSSDDEKSDFVEEIDQESSSEDEDTASEDENEEENDSIAENEANFKHLRDTDVSDEISKGTCVRNQLSIWESLLEMRIQLQKCLITANKLPQAETFVNCKNEGDSDFQKKTAQTEQGVSNLLAKLLLLQSLCLKQYPETKRLLKETDSKEEGESEEIISSDEDNSESEENNDEEPEAKRRKCNDYGKTIDDSHLKYRKYRDSVIQKWDDKTKISVSKNNVNISVLNQINHILLDKNKLIERTRLKRSNYEILGKSNDEERDTEIFDDDDFYHQILRELIEFKSADVTDPIQLGRQWVQLQSMRSKMRKAVDTKATKGRKIRYTVHPKLVNFMAPMEENNWTDETKNDLFISLFGKKRMKS